MARVWMHNGFLQVEGRKMAKSEGNFITIRELLNTSKFGGRKWHGLVLRLAMLMTHYRQPLNWSQASLFEARGIWEDMVEAAADVMPAETVPSELITSLKDDLNTPSAIAFLHHLKDGARAGNHDAAREMLASLDFLGLIPKWEWFNALPDFIRITAKAEDFFEKLIAEANGDANTRQLVVRTQSALEQQDKSLDSSVLQVANQMSAAISIRDLRDLNLNPAKVSDLIAGRNAARAAKNWKESDRIRERLAAMGVVLKDSKDGTTWEIKR
jgi:cysteinyl-tRNA synthetase